MEQDLTMNARTNGIGIKHQEEEQLPRRVHHAVRLFIYGYGSQEWLALETS
jgi:hypothetical protein